jgi:hypothetical protein
LSARISVDTSTNSDIFSDLLTINITKVAGSRLYLHFLFSCSSPSANTTAYFRFLVDGVAKDGTGSRLSAMNQPQSGGVHQLISGLAVGAHIIKVQWRSEPHGNTVRILPVTNPDYESASLEVTEFA